MTIGVFPNSTQFGAVMELYTGVCGALVSTACANGFDGDPVQLPLNGMVPGNTYYVRVYNGYSNTPYDDAGYSLCVAEGYVSTKPVCSRFSRAIGPASKCPSTATPQSGHSRRLISRGPSQEGQVVTRRAMVRISG